MAICKWSGTQTHTTSSTNIYLSIFTHFSCWELPILDLPIVQLISVQSMHNITLKLIPPSWSISCSVVHLAQYPILSLYKSPLPLGAC